MLRIRTPKIMVVLEGCADLQQILFLESIFSITSIGGDHCQKSGFFSEWAQYLHTQIYGCFQGVCKYLANSEPTLRILPYGQALHMACLYARPECVAALVELGCDTNIRTCADDGSTTARPAQGRCRRCNRTIVAVMPPRPPQDSVCKSRGRDG